MDMLIIAGIIRGVHYNEDGGIILRVETTSLTPAEKADLGAIGGDPLYVAFKKERFASDEKEIMGGLKADKPVGKSKSQVLRSALFRLWERRSEGFVTFDEYYEFMMNRYIDRVKEELDGFH